jgi:ADP-ribosylglycohydrolase
MGPREGSGTRGCPPKSSETRVVRMASETSPHAAADESLIGRAIGCLVGLALGDALGAAVEFQAPGTFPPVSGIRGGGPHGLAAGQSTDDTSMAPALADSTLAVGWDLEDQASRYVDWWQGGNLFGH